MTDKCFWCRQIRCRNGHLFDMRNYRIELHQRALNLLAGFEYVKMEPSDRIRLERAIKKLMSLKPVDMGIDEHRIKGHFLRLRKIMGEERAYEQAEKEAKKDARRTHPVYPLFTKQEMLNILQYRPKNGSM